MPLNFRLSRLQTRSLLSKGGVSYTYPASGPGSVRPHAVTSFSSGRTYQYDANGNVTQRVESGTTYVQEFDAENRLERVTVGGQVSEFSYDGDGKRVKKVAGGQTTVYVGNYYEKQGTTVTTYYYTTGWRVAMRVDDLDRRRGHSFHSRRASSAVHLLDDIGRRIEPLIPLRSTELTERCTLQWISMVSVCQ